jgi:hypothetical protein
VKFQIYFEIQVKHAICLFNPIKFKFEFGVSLNTNLPQNFTPNISKFTKGLNMTIQSKNKHSLVTLFIPLINKLGLYLENKHHMK